MCHCVLSPHPPRHRRLWLSDSVGPGYSPVVRPALNTGLLPPNYQLQGSASTPGAGQAGNELSPLGWTSGWAVYGGGWALPFGGVNGPSRGTVSRADPSDSLITEQASCCIAVQTWMFISCIRSYMSLFEIVGTDFYVLFQSFEPFKSDTKFKRWFSRSKLLKQTAAKRQWCSDMLHYL